MTKSLKALGISELYVFPEWFIQTILRTRFGDWSTRKIGKIQRRADRSADSDYIDITFNNVEVELIDPGENVFNTTSTVDIYLHLKGIKGSLMIGGEEWTLTDADWPLRGELSLTKANQDGENANQPYGQTWHLRLGNAAMKNHFLERIDDNPATELKDVVRSRNALYELLVTRGGNSPLWSNLAQYIGMILPVNCGGSGSTIRFGRGPGFGAQELLVVTPSTAQGVAAVPGGPWALLGPAYYHDYPDIGAKMEPHVKPFNDMLAEFTEEYFAGSGPAELLFNSQLITFRYLRRASIDASSEHGIYMGSIATQLGKEEEGYFKFKVALQKQTITESGRIVTTTPPDGRKPRFRYTMLWTLTGGSMILPEGEMIVMSLDPVLTDARGSTSTTWTISLAIDLDFKADVIQNHEQAADLSFEPFLEPLRVEWDCVQSKGATRSYTARSEPSGQTAGPFRDGAIHVFTPDFWVKKVKDKFHREQYPLLPSLNWKCTVVQDEDPLVGVRLAARDTWLHYRAD